MKGMLLLISALLVLGCTISTCPEGSKEVVREIIRIKVDTVVVYDTKGRSDSSFLSDPNNW